MNYTKKIFPGIAISVVIGFIGWHLGNDFPVIGGPVFGMVIGIAVTTFFPNIKSQKNFNLNLGVNYTAKKILQYSIIFLGFNMNLFDVISIGKQSFLLIVFTLLSAFITGFLINKLLNLEKNKAILVTVGTSICGGSAIAATAPVINASDEDIAQSISTIFLFNIIAVIIFPLIGRSLNMSDTTFGMWAGTAINDTSSVVAAASSWSLVSGNEVALNLATIVKLTRTLMIIPITLILSIYTSKNKEDTNFNIIKIFPWFIIGFIFSSVVNTMNILPQSLSNDLLNLGKFMIIMAMSAIGLNTDIKKLLSNGFKPVFLGICCWLSVAISSLFIQMI